MGNDNFFTYVNILTKSQEEVEDIIIESKQGSNFMPTPFEFLLSNCYHNEEYNRIAQEAFYLFLNQPVTFLYESKSILIGDIDNVIDTMKNVEDLVLITEDDFFEFQNKIRVCMGYKEIEPPIENEDPRIKRIKAKARYRDKVKAKQGKNISLGTNLAAICCMQIGINPLNIGELSYASVQYLTHMYQNKEEYNLDMK